MYVWCDAMYTAGQAYSSSSGVQREQLLSATERVRATGDRIKQGKQTLLETEELGVSILQDLHKQRETIVHARDNVRTHSTLCLGFNFVASTAHRPTHTPVDLWGHAWAHLVGVELGVWVVWGSCTRRTTIWDELAGCCR